jgi:hypothetical protein
MKFKNYIETESGIKDTSTSPGTAGQVLSSTVAGTSWIDQSTLVSGSAERVSILVKNGEGTALVKGDPVYIIGSVGASARLEVGLCDASNPSKMPCVGLLEQDLLNNGEGTAVTAGKLRNLITTPIDGQPTTENDTIYVKAGGSSGLALTTTKPTGSTNLIQNVGQVGRVSSSSDGNLVVSAIMRTNDVPNLPTGRIWVGDGNTIVSDVVYLDETNGHMGIGTTSPNDNLEIKSTTIPRIRLNSTDTSFPTFGSITAYNNTTYRGELSWANNPVQAGAKITYIGFPLGSQTTGTFEVGADFVATTISNGSMVTRLNTTGLGIGTTSPGEKLHVDGSIRVGDTNDVVYADKFFTVSNANLHIGANNGYDTVFFNGPADERMRITSTGNVGIGTNSPNRKIHIVSSEYVIGDFVRSTGTNAYLSFQDQTTSGSGFVGVGAAGNDLLLRSGNLERVRVISNGNVGIGTTNPARRLEVYDSSSSIISQFRSGSGTSSFICFANDGSTADQVRIGSISTNLVLSTNYTERMRVDSSGNVGIGTTSPNAKLHVYNTGNGEIEVERASGALINIQAQSAKGVIGTDSNHTLSLKTNSSERLTILNTGNVGIGTTSPSQKLDVVGSAQITDDIYLGRYIFHDGDTNTWLGFPSTDSFVVRTNGSDRFYINSSGNVGIGTNSPSSKLQVNGDLTVGDDSTVGSFINVIAAGASQDAGIRFGSESNTDSKAAIYTNTSNSDLHFDVTESTRMLIDSGTGNVGIGTTSPQEKLHVQNYTTGESHQAMFKGGAVTVGDYSYISLNNGYGAEYNKEVRLAAVSEQSNSNKTGFAILTSPDSTGASGHERLRVTADGNVGIGTTSPGHELVVQGTSSPNIELKNSNYSNGGFVLNRTNYTQQWKWWAEYNQMYFGFATDESTYSNKMTIQSGGNVGIGTTSPSDRLEVAAANSQLRLTDTDDSKFTQFSYSSGKLVVRNNSTTTTTNQFTLDLDGKMGIGTTSPSYKLDVTGEGRFTGDLRCLSLIQTSQRDQKKDIADIDKSKAKAIPFKEYKYKSSIDGSERKRYGVVVEDIEDDYPELVHTDADGIKGINYIDLLVKRVAELEKELEDISLTPGPKGDTGATGSQGPAGANGTNGNDHLKNVQSIAFNEKSGQLEITIEGYKGPFRFNPAK